MDDSAVAEIADKVVEQSSAQVGEALQTAGWYGLAASLVYFLASWAIRSWYSRPLTPAPPVPKLHQHYSQITTSLPIERSGYSDRIAYLMAELSYFAYYPFETLRPSAEELAEALSISGIGSLDDANNFINDNDLYADDKVRVANLRAFLLEADFQLVATLVNSSLQGFVVRYQGPGCRPFLAVVFRGTEQKASDWLTNIGAIPDRVGGIHVPTPGAIAHTGMFASLSASAIDIQTLIDSDAAKDGEGNLLPVYFTGHSLGGALATLASAVLAPGRSGACYTFGAPRVANYEFFFHHRTPVFRVVNSADAIPHVPPGPITRGLRRVLELAALLTYRFQALADLFDKLVLFVSRMEHYRHHGDLRFLTDVPKGSFEQANVLQNPPLSDQALWLFKGLAADFKRPVRSHSMFLYREKLANIAIARDKKKADHEIDLPVVVEGTA